MGRVVLAVVLVAGSFLAGAGPASAHVVSAQPCAATSIRAACPGAADPADAPVGTIEDVIDTEMPASGAPGLAYAVVDGGEVTGAGARGVATMGEERKVTPDTPFVTGSISKSFPALAVMQLVEAGKVGLDTDIGQYLDAFAGRPAGAVTVRQLLSHTSRVLHHAGEPAVRRRHRRAGRAGRCRRPGARLDGHRALVMVHDQASAGRGPRRSSHGCPAGPASPSYGFGWFVAPDGGVWHTG